MTKKVFTIGFVLYAILCAVVFSSWLPYGPADGFAGDADAYNRGAINLAQSGFYSYDGIHPTAEREPGYSLFLAVIYWIFGIGNFRAVFIVQALVYVAAVTLFCRQLVPMAGKRTAGIAFFLLLTQISVFHAIFTLYREISALIALLLFATVFLSYQRKSTYMKAIGMGITLGYSILCYFSFLFFPFALVGLLLWQKFPWKHILISFLICMSIVSVWVLRNKAYGDSASMASWRVSVMLYVRGEQAVRVTGTEPFMCLWAEYISRNWEGRSSACSFNGVMHTELPEKFDQTFAAKISGEAKQKILSHIGNYLWFSVFEILELHLPFVGAGWSRLYNIAASVTLLCTYIGCLFSWLYVRMKKYLLFVLLIGYNTSFFILTDATPRYLMPVIFCYVLFAALGYNRLLTRFTKA
ncbi:MAG: glycosyltransferase family 39 protein [Candidatus Peribacteraceae bacterium]|nr:glycosyltransferase family 39 protein [Candidatus Peribacteraceae bacterium]